VSNRKPSERTIGGLAGKLVGRAREALASASGNDQAGREGRLKERARAGVSDRQAAVDAGHERLGSEISAAQQEQRTERDRVQPRARTKRTAAERAVLAAERVRVAATEEADRLEREAREAEQRRAP
jgi:hypothetical protein